ncbi:hypothetical protein JVU11DRAFT_8996 [Chiua virens]|nr:hypothetical protein JVU11DRAFT_8996 [Chiua virens]
MMLRVLYIIEHTTELKSRVSHPFTPCALRLQVPITPPDITMVNFAELKAKAEKAKDASVTKMTNTRDRLSSTPSSKVNWDPNWKRAPPPRPGYPSAAGMGGKGAAPPVPSWPEGDANGPPAISRASRPTDDARALPSYVPPPPPTRASSAYPPGHGHRTNASVASQDTGEEKIDWANLSLEDKVAFFGWLDEFFSRYLGVELGPRGKATSPLMSGALPGQRLPSTRAPPMVNIATRPQV